jgi:CHASE3 domain sensor protein
MASSAPSGRAWLRAEAAAGDRALARCAKVPWRTLSGFVAAVGAIVIAVAAYFIVVVDRDRKAADVTERSEAVRSLQGLEDALARAESAQRGYLLTRDAQQLEAYRRAVADIEAELDAARQRVARRPDGLSVDALSALVEAKLAVCAAAWT